MCKHDPGVDHIHLYVAISLAKKFTLFQKSIIGSILHEVSKCKWITCESVILKPNLGREFSSLQHCLLAMKPMATNVDYILVRNRSSRGPFKSRWYKEYMDQFLLHENTGMVGSTINHHDHFARGLTENVSHIQSYVFLSQWKYLSDMLPDFPGIKAINHLDAVISGEIELSQRILRSGARISCLRIPEKILDIHSQNDPAQLIHQPTRTFNELPIIHRKRDIFGFKLRMRQLLYTKILWLLLQKKRNVMFLDKSESNSSW